MNKEQVTPSIKPFVPGFPNDLIQGMIFFLPIIPRGKSVLNLAGGPSDLMNEIRSRGFTAVGISDDQEKIKKYTEDGFQMIQGSFLSLASLKIPEELGGVWAGRSFEQLDRDQIEKLIGIAHLILPEKAPLFFSVPLKQMTAVNSTYTKEDILHVLSSANFLVTNQWEETGLDGKMWWAVVAITAPRSTNKYMSEIDFEGTLVLEKLAEIGKVEAFYEAIDADNFDLARSLMKKANVDSETITQVLKMMNDA